MPRNDDRDVFCGKCWADGREIIAGADACAAMEVGGEVVERAQVSMKDGWVNSVKGKKS